MKLTTWNVNGLRSVLGKKALDWVWREQPDALCLQEIKSRPDQLTDEQRNFPDYEAFWSPAERAGYSGVATLLRTPALETRFGMDIPRFDVEGRVLSTFHPGFRLFNLYVPNGQRGKDRLDYKLDFYACLLKQCDELHARGENLILTGDFNTAHQPIDLKKPKQNEQNSGFMPEEREWVQKYLDHGFVDIYRRLYPDRAQYTWWTYIGNARARGVGWRIDYFLVSEALVPRVRDVVIRDEIMGSDHCPVELILE